MANEVVASLRQEDLEMVRDALEAVGDEDFAAEAEELADDSNGPDWPGRFVAHAATDRADVLGYIAGRPDEMYRQFVTMANPGPLGLASVVYVWGSAHDGIATKLMWHLVEHLAELGCTYLTVSINGNLDGTDPQTPDARFNFSARHGFVTNRCGLVILNDAPGAIVAGGPLPALQARLAQRLTISP